MTNCRIYFVIALKTTDFFLSRAIINRERVRSHLLTNIELKLGLAQLQINFALGYTCKNIKYTRTANDWWNFLSFAKKKKK